MDFASIANKMIRAARLDVSLYEEVEADEGATTEALVVVLIVAIAGGIGALGGGLGGFILAIVSALVGWVVFAFLTYIIGTTLFGGTATMGEMLRTLGYAYSPGVLDILTIVSVIPCLGPLVALLIVLFTWVWRLATTVVAVRQALDFDTTKAILTCLLGWLAGVVVVFLVSGLGAGLGALAR